MKKALVVEDQASMAKIVGNILKKDYEVYYAINGKQGIEKAIEFKPDVIIMDIMMPVLDGFEAIRELRKIPELKKTVICVLTAKGGTEDNEKAIESGATGFLAKPFSSQDLLDELKRLSEV